MLHLIPGILFRVKLAARQSKPQTTESSQAARTPTDPLTHTHVSAWETRALTCAHRAARRPWIHVRRRTHGQESIKY
jgi:hypothetical protein